MLPDADDLEEAAALVYGILQPTGQFRWPLLSQRLGVDLVVKHENHTPLGAFKMRGGIVYLTRLLRRSPGLEGIAAATRGNHGQSLAFAARQLGLRARVVVPHGNSKEKNAAMVALGAELHEVGDDFQDCLEALDEIAEGPEWAVAPSVHRDLVAGVASCGLELLRAEPDLDTVYVPIGLGSGLCGLAAARAALGHRVRIVGVVATGAPACLNSLRSGRLESAPVTTVIADGMACRTPNGQALELIRNHAARVVEVSDGEIEAAMRACFSATHNVAEGAGAAALAAITRDRDHLKGRTVGAILTGGNVDREVYGSILANTDAPDLPADAGAAPANEWSMA